MNVDEPVSYNLAMFIKRIYQVHRKDQLNIAAGIVEVTIIAGAALSVQKAYLNM